MVSTHLKNISQIGSFPQIGTKIKNIWNHHPVFLFVENTWKHPPVFFPPVDVFLWRRFECLAQKSWMFRKASRENASSLHVPKTMLLWYRISSVPSIDFCFKVFQKGFHTIQLHMEKKGCSENIEKIHRNQSKTLDLSFDFSQWTSDTLTSDPFDILVKWFLQSGPRIQL